MQSQSPHHIHPIILIMIPAAVDMVDIIAQVCNQLASYVQLLNLQNASWQVKFNHGDIYIYIEPQCYSGCHNGGTCISPNKCKCTSGWTGYTCSQGRTSDNNFGLCSVSLMYVDINECNGDHKCQYQCQNSQGSYTCLCPSGYQLKLDGRACGGQYICSIFVACLLLYI